MPKFSYVNNSKLEQLLSANSYLDTLQLTGEYKEAFVSYNENSGTYRVSTEEPPTQLFWNLLSKKPNKLAPAPKKLADFYIASCSVFGGNSTSCSTSLAIDGLHVKLDTTEENIFLKEKLALFLSKELTAWESNCK